MAAPQEPAPTAPGASEEVVTDTPEELAAAKTSVAAAKKRKWSKRLKTTKKFRKVLRAQIGDPYRYGAEGPNAFDCSGLVQYAYKKAGIKLPRTAGAQYRAGNKIRWKNVRRGDLIQFYGGGHIAAVSYVKGKKVVVIVARKTGTNVQKMRIDNKSYYMKNMDGVSRVW